MTNHCNSSTSAIPSPISASKNGITSSELPPADGADDGVDDFAGAAAAAAGVAAPPACSMSTNADPTYTQQQQEKARSRWHQKYHSSKFQPTDRFRTFTTSPVL